MSKPKPETLRVAFRVDRRRGQSREVCAVLPDNDANPGRWVMYVHHGQHSEGDRAWYYQCTRRATPEEYAPLLRELERIYAPEFRLRVVSRIAR